MGHANTVVQLIHGHILAADQHTVLSIALLTAVSLGACLQVAGQPLQLQLPTRAQRCSRLTAQAAATDAEVAVGDTYEVFLTKPLGIR